VKREFLFALEGRRGRGRDRGLGAEIREVFPCTGSSFRANRVCDGIGAERDFSQTGVRLELYFPCGPVRWVAQDRGW
jgi:hypothetical protein